jgi:hypothetical protein
MNSTWSARVEVSSGERPRLAQSCCREVICCMASVRAVDEEEEGHTSGPDTTCGRGRAEV